MDLATPEIVKRGSQLHVKHGDDSGLFVTFYDHTVEMTAESEKQGHPVFKDVPFIRIIFPGNTTTRVERPVKMTSDQSSPSDPERFPRAWQAYKSQSIEVEQGLPVTEWPAITKAMAQTLKALDIHTVEAMATVSDHALTFLGARELREKARSYLANAKDGAENTRLQAENQQLRTDVEMLKEQMSQLMSDKANADQATAGAQPRATRRTGSASNHQE